MVFLLAFVGSLSARAQDASPQIDGSNLTASLLTFGPGSEVWERFGHNAILIDDAATGESRLYNYGIFDFDQENFFVNFARGKMTYRMAVGDPNDELPLYVEEGRWIVRQELALSPAQRRKLAQFLDWNVQPANKFYRYNYFTANCSTKTRDALDLATDGALKNQMISPSRGFTYRADVMRLMRPDPLLMLGMDAGLGPYADRRLTLWDESFSPTELMRRLREVTIVDPNGGARVPLVAKETRLADARLPEPDETPPVWIWPAFGVGVFSALLILLLGRSTSRASARALLAVSGIAIESVLGIGGLVLLGLWFLTDHESAWRNQNLMLLDPLCLLLIPAWFGSFGARWMPTPFARGVTIVVLFFAGLSLFVKVFQPIPQDNRFWIALLLPIHIALAIALLTRRRTRQFSSTFR